MDPWTKYTNPDKFELRKSQESKTAEANIEESKHYWKVMSEYRLFLRQQRVRPIAADFFDIYPKPTNRQNDHTLSTTARPCHQMPDRDTPTVDAGQGLANEELPYRGKSEKRQAFPSQLSVSGGIHCSARDETAFISAPPSGLGQRFRKTFGPVASVDANGAIIDR